MKSRRTLLVGLLLAGVIVSAGWMLQPPARLNFQPESKLWFEGTSSLHDWKCTAAQVSGFVDGDLNKLKVSKAEATIPVMQIDCGHKAMNGRMQTVLKAQQNPQIRYQLRSAKTQGTAVQTHGLLTVSGVTKPIAMTLTSERQAGGKVVFKGSTPLKMTDFGLEPPAFLGMTTGNDITVGFEVVVGP